MFERKYTLADLVNHARNPGIHGQVSASDARYVKADGTTILTADWDIGDGRAIYADKIRARDTDGLYLVDDGNVGIFIADGGQVGIGTTTFIDANDKAYIKDGRLVLGRSFAGNTVNLAIYNYNTTDPCGSVISARTDTTGVGAKAFTEVGALRWKTTTHNHATRATECSIYVTNAGTLTEAFKIASTGAITGSSTITGTQLISNIATGTKPLNVTSTTVCTNLNADQLDGVHESALFLANGSRAIGGDIFSADTVDLVLRNYNDTSYIMVRDSDDYLYLYSVHDAAFSAVDSISISSDYVSISAAAGTYGYIDLNTDNGVNVKGDLDVTGALSKGSGTFRIDHPVLPDTLLYHGFVESPEYGLIYCGIAKLEKGKADVDIDSACRMTKGTFEALCRNPRIVLQNNDTFDRVKPSKVNSGTFTIECENEVNVEITWIVYAERKDAFILTSKTTDDQGHLITEVSNVEYMERKRIREEHRKAREGKIGGNTTTGV